MCVCVCNCCVCCTCNCCVCCVFIDVVCIAYHYGEHKGRYGTQKHREVATEAHHTKDGRDDGEDEVMITDWAVAWCIHCHL